MRSRYLDGSIQGICFASGKMAFVYGPRQCGTTTFGKMLLKRRASGLYWNWDDVEFRRIWAKHPRQAVPAAPAGVVPMLVLDEIHKDRRWKRTLKGVYDTLETPCDILVTGSSRLNVYMRGSDSLLGRYYPFRLHPFSLRELAMGKPSASAELAERIFARSLEPASGSVEALDLLMRFGPFPEPLLGQEERRARLWRRTRSRIIVREELRDLSRTPELARIEMMVALLPERVGAPFSVTSLREDLEVSHDTVKRWLTYLKELFYLFEVKPYSRKVPRSLRKEGKVYLWEYREVEDEAARFENLVASHLLKACHYWTDTGEGAFDLTYLRNKEKQEIDFLVLRDGRPWLPVEVKLRQTDPSPNWRRFLDVLGCKHGIQVVAAPAWRIHDIGSCKVLVAGAAEILNYLV